MMCVNPAVTLFDCTNFSPNYANLLTYSLDTIFIEIMMKIVVRNG